jgi:hypothetical protein
MSLVCRLLNAEWDDDFLVVPPGKAVGMSYDETIIEVKELAHRGDREERREKENPQRS